MDSLHQHTECKKLRRGFLPEKMSALCSASDYIRWLTLLSVILLSGIHYLHMSSVKFGTNSCHVENKVDTPCFISLEYIIKRQDAPVSLFLGTLSHENAYFVRTSTRQAVLSGESIPLVVVDIGRHAKRQFIAKKYRNIWVALTR